MIHSVINLETKTRAERNRTITLSLEEQNTLLDKCIVLESLSCPESVEDKLICQDIAGVIPFLPSNFVDLLYIDPPYNLSKTFHSISFKELSSEEYAAWFEEWFTPLLKVLKSDGSVYVCADWRTSNVIYPILARHLVVRNRITWEREKGRGAMRNWKNCSEDIWFRTRSQDYTFNADAVRIKRKVLAPYRQNGIPKDWQTEAEGGYRLTAPSNLWTDVTVPFWSMPENTDHPTQKPEKLVAKSVLASTNPGDIVFDPFAGSGTTCVVAKKLNRRYIGVEIEPFYCALAQRRLDDAESHPAIQGYENGVFYERNSQPPVPERKTQKDLSLF